MKVARVVFRVVAIAIAVAAIVDPAITVTGATRARVAIVNLEPASTDAARVRARLVDDLGSAYDIVPQISSDVAAAVMIGRGYPGARAEGSRAEGTEAAPATVSISTVTLPEPAEPRIARVSGPREVPAATSIHIDVDVDGHATAGQTTEVSARLAGLELARVSHRWTADRERWRASLDLVPIGDPPFVIRIDAGADAADFVVGLRTQPLRVEFYDPRPSWATTFVRRALEEDARFRVESLSFSSRGVAARTTGDVPLADSQIASFDALVVGGLERLSATDVHALDRYMRERGGAVVLVPDARIDAGPARDLLPDASERLLEQPATLVSTHGAASLQASELLVMRGQPIGAEVVAVTPGTDPAPVIVSMPRGAGRLLVSGAMDAWRWRAAGQASFDRFWPSLIAGLALAALPTVDVDVTPAILRPGEHAEVIVRTRGQNVSAASATIDRDQPLRLWPDAEPGVYHGRLTAPAKPGRLTIEARVAASPERAVDQASRRVTITTDARHASGGVTPALSMLSASHGGVDVTPERVADVERFVRGAVQPPRVPTTRHPMRSVWWIVPFAVVLSAEWWLRRKRGLR
jgi:hypothetical protein